MSRVVAIATLVSVVAMISSAFAQTMPADDMAGMDMHDMHDMDHMDHAAHAHDGATSSSSHGGMTGMLGPYPMTRESSGTSWQPESTPMDGLHLMRGDWMFMVHGFADLIYDYQGGPRGDDKTFSTNMLMLMARRPLGPGTFGARTMLSLEPATIGQSGYPLLFQTGETADNQTPLIDRQHPHDLLMEVAGSYSLNIGERSAAFVYLGYPGEPALGPPTFMHRFSGEDNPEAPITHHWLDSTHITYGVATVGYVWRNWKLEGSIFTGREPDEKRWVPDEPKFDSQSVRLTFDPTPDWSLQASYGRINSPEQLEPEVDQNRVTASAMYNHRIGATSNWQTTAAWGQNDNEPGHTLNAYLIETALVLNRQHTFFGRYENVQKDELFQEGEPFAGRVFTVNKLSLGYIYDFATWRGLRFGVGALGSVYFIGEDLQKVYGDLPLSGMIFARVKL